MLDPQAQAALQAAASTCNDSNNTPRSLSNEEKLYELIDNLSIEEKSRVARRLLNCADLHINIGNAAEALTPDLMGQLKSMNNHDIGSLLNALAERIQGS